MTGERLAPITVLGNHTIGVQPMLNEPCRFFFNLTFVILCYAVTCSFTWPRWLYHGRYFTTYSALVMSSIFFIIHFSFNSQHTHTVLGCLTLHMPHVLGLSFDNKGRSLVEIISFISFTYTIDGKCSNKIYQ